MPYQDHGKISVLMSVYNGATTLEKSINSILAQTYQNLEFIICDDASTDETWSILQRYKRQDARVYCFQNEENLGLGASLNRCFTKASGQYIARQDADDISDKDRLEKTVEFLLSGTAPYVACGVRVFDDSGIWSTRQYPQIITKHIIAQKNPFFHPTMMFRRKTLELAHGYSEEKKTRRTEDYDLVMRLASMNLIGENMQEILYSVYEPADAYLRHTRKTRWYEIQVRWRGLHMMNAPVADYIFLAKPIVMGLIPRCFLKQIKKLQWGALRREMRNT